MAKCLLRHDDAARIFLRHTERTIEALDRISRAAGEGPLPHWMRQEINALYDGNSRFFPRLASLPEQLEDYCLKPGPRKKRCKCPPEELPPVERRHDKPMAKFPASSFDWDLWQNTQPNANGDFVYTTLSPGTPNDPPWVLRGMTNVWNWSPIEDADNPYTPESQIDRTS